MGDISYYVGSIIPPFSQWDVTGECVVTDSSITITPEAEAIVYMSGTVSSGLMASKYIRFACTIDIADTTYTGRDGTVSLKLHGDYNKSNNEVEAIVYTLSPSILDKTTNNMYILDEVLEMPNRDMNYMVLKIKNNTSSNIVVSACSAYRSMDVSSSQAAESVEIGSSISDIQFYNNCIRVKQTNSGEYINLYYIGTENQLTGVNVNNQRVITVSSFNSNFSE